LALVTFLSQFSPKLLQPWLQALALDLLKTDPVYASCSCVGSNLLPGGSQGLWVTDQSVQTVEAKSLLLFGFRTQLRSPNTNFLRQLRFP